MPSQRLGYMVCVKWDVKPYYYYYYWYFCMKLQIYPWCVCVCAYVEL